MLSTEEALRCVLAHSGERDVELVPLSEATGRFLQQPIVAERDQPPFDRVTMDGIAFRMDDLDAATRRLPIQGTQLAGDAVIELAAGHCIEIMTGAALPAGANAVVPIERITIDDKHATVQSEYDIQAMRFIHPRASDYAAGEHLLQPGRRISPLDIAVIASSGVASVSVSTSPVVSIISTGNELVAAGRPIADHQIRLSNGPALSALLAANQFVNSTHEHINDDVGALQQRLAQHLEHSDVIILSGGVSMGKADFVPRVLRDLNVDEVFHKVSQRPGKPMWFGTGPDGQLVFGLPGNPVSALVCCRRYVLPALLAAAGHKAGPPEIVALAKAISFPAPLTCFQPVRLLSNAAGTTLAMPVQTNTSGDFRALAESDGYIELDQNQDDFASGSSVVLSRWVHH